MVLAAGCAASERPEEEIDAALPGEVDAAKPDADEGGDFDAAAPDATVVVVDAAVIDAPPVVVDSAVIDAPPVIVVDAAAIDAPPVPDDATVIDAPPVPTPDAHVPVPTTDFAFTGQTNTAQFGNLTGGALFEDKCPAGQALIGFTGSLNGSANGYHQQLAALCGKVQRVDNNGVFVAQTSTGASLPTRGVLSGAFSWQRACPANHVISGFVGRSGALIDQFVFSCRPITIAADGVTLTTGAAVALPAIGGSGGNAFAQTDCPAGLLANVARIRAGDGVDAFGIACAMPSVTAP
jgi:hypothetical protein